MYKHLAMAIGRSHEYDLVLKHMQMKQCHDFIEKFHSFLIECKS